MKLFRIASGFLLLLGGFVSHAALADGEGGVGLSATRMIYPAASTEERMGIHNTSTSHAFLMQSWITDAQGKKTNDFIITPPLFVLKPGKEAALRVTLTRKQPLPSDRESLYYLNSKAIPSIDQNQTKGRNVLQIATQNTIKVFVRPDGLKVPLKDAPSMITCRRAGKTVIFTNASPYYVTLVRVKTGGRALANIMVPPRSSAEEDGKGATGAITYQTVNDFGALSPSLTCK